MLRLLRLRYSLRTLAVLITIVGAVTALYVAPLLQWQRRAAAIAYIRHAGGTVYLRNRKRDRAFPAALGEFRCGDRVVWRGERSVMPSPMATQR